MKKSVSFGAKPTSPVDKNPDEWVMNRNVGTTDPMAVTEAAPHAEPMKRLTIDVTASLHAQMKSRCALNGVKMADEVRALLLKHFTADDEKSDSV